MRDEDNNCSEKHQAKGLVFPDKNKQGGRTFLNHGFLCCQAAFSRPQVPVCQCISVCLQGNHRHAGKRQDRKPELFCQDAQQSRENHEGKAAHGTGKAKVQRRFRPLQAHAQVQVQRVHRHHEAHIQNIADSTQQITLRIDPQRNQDQHLQPQKGIYNLSMADFPVPVNPGTEYRTEHSAADISQRQNHSQLLIVITGAVQEHSRVCCHHAECHPESAGYHHVMKSNS